MPFAGMTVCSQFTSYGAQSIQSTRNGDDKHRSSAEVGRAVAGKASHPLPPLYIFKTLQVII
jgi:hypothetical protein